MSANVFFIIMPNQRIGLPTSRRGGCRCEIRKIANSAGTHNNYLTLRLIFLNAPATLPTAFASENELATRRWYA